MDKDLGNTKINFLKKIFINSEILFRIYVELDQIELIKFKIVEISS